MLVDANEPGKLTQYRLPCSLHERVTILSLSSLLTLAFSCSLLQFLSQVDCLLPLILRLTRDKEKERERERERERDRREDLEAALYLVTDDERDDEASTHTKFHQQTVTYSFSGP